MWDFAISSNIDVLFWRLHLHGHTHAHSQECTWECLQVIHPRDSLTVSLSHQPSPTVNESCTNAATRTLQSQAALSLSHIISTTHTHTPSHIALHMMLWVWFSMRWSRKAPQEDLLLVKEPFHCSKNRFPGEFQHVFWGHVMMLTSNKVWIGCEVHFEQIQYVDILDIHKHTRNH